MARTRYGPDRGLTARMMGTLFGLGLMYVVLGAVLWAVGFSAVLVLAITGAMLAAQWWFSDSMAMSAMRAHIVTPEQAPQLHGVVDRLVAMADMPKPRVAIADNDVPNAFATGRTPSRAVVVVTTGLLRRLDRDELEGVLAHELSHVAHKDVAVMTIASFTAILAGFLVRSAMWGSLTRDRRDNNTALVFLAVMVVSVLVYVVSYLLTRALSRYRELGADRGAAMITGQPSALARALQKVSGEAGQIPTSDLRAMEPVASFAFVPALSGGRRGFDLGRLMSTHPPLEQRLEQLARIAGQLGGAVTGMGFWDGVLGRRKPVRPDLDSLFAVPSAAITLQASLDLVPTGRGSVAFRAPEGRAFADLAAEVRALLDADGGPPVEVTPDSFGYTWVVVRTDPPDVAAVVTDLHAVNASLEGSGFGPQLLASLVSFRAPGDRPVGLVYLYKRGTFYPFAPDPGGAQQRDTVYELQVRDTLGSDLRVEPDLTRWFAVWGAPGL